MPALLFLRSWKLWAVLAAVALIGGTAWFAVRTYNRTLAQNVQLSEDLKARRQEAKDLREHQARVNEAVTINDQNTRTIVERTQRIEERIREVPTTKACLDSPAVGVLLNDYRVRNGSAPAQPVTPVP